MGIKIARSFLVLLILLFSNIFVFAGDIDNLVRVCRKEQIIPINLDLDRQLFPFATRSEIFDHVGQCVEELYLPQGGLSLNVELNYETSIDNCVAILDALEKYRHYKK